MVHLGFEVPVSEQTKPICVYMFLSFNFIIKMETKHVIDADLNSNVNNLSNINVPGAAPPPSNIGSSDNNK